MNCAANDGLASRATPDEFWKVLGLAILQRGDFAEDNDRKSSFEFNQPSMTRLSSLTLSSMSNA